MPDADFRFTDPREELHRRLVLMGPGPAAFFKDTCALMAGSGGARRYPRTISSRREFTDLVSAIPPSGRYLRGALSQIIEAPRKVADHSKKHVHGRSLYVPGRLPARDCVRPKT